MSKALSCGLATLGVDVFGGRLQIYVLVANLVGHTVHRLFPG